MSVTARTQPANKKLALQRLQAMFTRQADKEKKEQETVKWNTHNELERGGAVATFSGLNFQPL
jgi:protein subunit release factor B